MVFTNLYRNWSLQIFHGSLATSGKGFIDISFSNNSPQVCAIKKLGIGTCGHVFSYISTGLIDSESSTARVNSPRWLSMLNKDHSEATAYCDVASLNDNPYENFNWKRFHYSKRRSGGGSVNLSSSRALQRGGHAGSRVAHYCTKRWANGKTSTGGDKAFALACQIVKKLSSQIKWH